ncbi:hypothetical protein COCVIDRAFT_22377 [Bipolaris victoriae FI3]|uniref:Carbohydrate-binding module family 18 protein n=1 Tax=Bipolaris victoriae (strain FI3) TaxID=930091 RepID=W7EVL5_BIPV3|nr:hypothetical protein COCVIDRAFT_22377 [Bipolaris victoriae FI3]
MKLVAVLATVLSVVSAVAIPAELQERQCLNNGIACTLPGGNGSCCSGSCHAILCGDTNTTCQPPGTACVTRKGNN